MDNNQFPKDFAKSTINELNELCKKYDLEVILKKDGTYSLRNKKR